MPAITGKALAASVLLLAVLFCSPTASSEAAVLKSEAAVLKSSASFDVPIFPDRVDRVIRSGTVNDPNHDHTPASAQLTPAVISLGGGKLVSVFSDAGTQTNLRSIGYAVSDNGGAGWVDMREFPPNPFGESIFPWLGVHRNSGTAYFSNTGVNSGGRGVFYVRRSIDAGHSWSAPVSASPGFNPSDVLRPSRIAVDNAAGAGNGFIYACFTSSTLGKIFLTRSTNGGASFVPSGGIEISATGGLGCSVAVGPNHEVYVVYVRGDILNGTVGDLKLFVRKSVDRGRSFLPEVQVHDLAANDVNPRGRRLPQIAVNPDPAKPFVYVVFDDDILPADPADGGDIFLSRSTNGGATWQPPQVVDASTKDQEQPAIAFAGPGQMMITYYSNSLDVVGNSTGHARARSGAVTATGRVALRPSFQISPNTPLDTIGMWHEINGSDGLVHAVWADDRNGDAYSSHQPDIRYANFRLPPVSANLKTEIIEAPSSLAIPGFAAVKVKVTALSGNAADVFLNMSAGRGLVFENPAGADCKIYNPYLDCSIGNIAAGKSRIILFTLRAAMPAGNPVIKAIATTSSWETQPSNNSAQRTILTVPLPGLITSQYTAPVLAAPIPDRGTIDIPVTVADAGEVAYVTVSTRIVHTYDRDLDISLISPAGAVVELSTDNGQSSDDYGSGATNCTGTLTTFDDSAAVPITDGTAPFAGVFRPEGNLSDYLASEQFGTWKLRVTDGAGGDTGTLHCFRLDITRMP